MVSGGCSTVRGGRPRPHPTSVGRGVVMHIGIWGAFPYQYFFLLFSFRLPVCNARPIDYILLLLLLFDITVLL